MRNCDQRSWASNVWCRAVANYCKIAQERVNCDGYKTGTNDIVCRLSDEKGIHSATYMLRHMQVEAVCLAFVALGR